jgi:hypothetical protein
MITLEPDSVLVQYFVWSCDHLPCTTSADAVEENGKMTSRDRSGHYYIAHGTTLCHLFWVTLWVPFACVAFISFAFSMFVVVHIGVHNNFMRGHADAGPLVDAAAYFIPEAFVACAVWIFGCLFLAIIGGSKTGFFSLLWQYLSGIKQRICPLVRFGVIQGEDSDV